MLLHMENPMTPLSPLPLFDRNIPITPSLFLQKDEQKGLLREGSSPPIASITADLDLAAKEDHKRSIDKENNHLSQEIDAIVGANDCDQEDDADDLGFDFSSSPTKRNKDILSNKNFVDQGYDKGSSKHNMHASSPRQPSVFLDYTPQQQQEDQNMKSFGIQPHFGHFFPVPNTHYGHAVTYQTSSSQRMPPFIHAQMDSNYTYQPKPNQMLGFSSPHPNLSNRVGQASERNSLSGNRDNEENVVPKSNEDGSYNTSGKAKALLRSPPPKKRRFVGSLDNKERIESDLLASPGPGIDVFRSPRDNVRGSPSIYSAGFGASFDMMDDTPRQRFEEDFPFDNSPGISGGDHKLMLTECMSDDEMMLPSTSSRRGAQQKKYQQSPHLMFDAILSPFRRSPHRHTHSDNVDHIAFPSASEVFGHFAPSPNPKRSPTLEVKNSASVEPKQQPMKYPHVSSTEQRQPISSMMPGFASPSTFKLQVRIGIMKIFLLAL